MMHFLGESVEALKFNGRILGGEDGKEKSSTFVIIAAISMYKRSKQAQHNKLVKKLLPLNQILSIEGKDPDECKKGSCHNPMDTEFNSVYGPNEMRCLALVSHNGMKDTMKKFVIAHKNVLKKFRLTGTQSTMTMLKSVFKGDDSIVYGPVCKSG